MTLATSDLAGLVTRYARRFHAVIGPQHHVASPSGACLLLALCARAASGDERRELIDVLGCEPEEAAALAAGLVETPHPLVSAAAAVWNMAGMGDEQWLAALPASVERGPIPSQDEADRWAREHTLGLIEKFPLKITDEFYLLLATALATKVSWDRPFGLAPGSALGTASHWGRPLERVLASPAGHTALVARTAQAGEVAVHVGRARDGLLVVSVIAAADVPAGEVLAAAHGLATDLALGRPVPRRSLFDLPLGDGPAMAGYTRVGFEAAAVTALAIALSAHLPGLRRTAEMRFCHPYAVVAVAAGDSARRGSAPSAWSGPWDGVPVFSPWVADPSEASDGDREAER
jgi:hypothetical protein